MRIPSRSFTGRKPSSAPGSTGSGPGPEWSFGASVGTVRPPAAGANVGGSDVAHDASAAGRPTRSTAPLTSRSIAPERSALTLVRASRPAPESVQCWTVLAGRAIGARRVRQASGAPRRAAPVTGTRHVRPGVGQLVLGAALQREAAPGPGGRRRRGVGRGPAQPLGREPAGGVDLLGRPGQQGIGRLPIGGGRLGGRPLDR